MNAIISTEHQNRLVGAFRAIRFALAALSAGSRVLALADNRPVIEELAARAARIYGSCSAAK
jgi:hypothetical protein